MKIKLSDPIQFGKDLIEELDLKPTAWAWREFSMPMTTEGQIEYQPYKLALVALEMAGVAGGASIMKKMSSMDMNALAQAVLGFLVKSPTTGSTP